MTRRRSSRISTRRIRRSRASAVLLRQAVTNSVMSKLGVGAHLHLFEDARPVGADGFDAERQLRRDFRHGLAAADHPQHLIFGVGNRARSYEHTSDFQSRCLAW